MIQFLNSNAGAVTALATIALLIVTGWYAWTTRALLREAEKTRLMAGEPRVVAYLRVHEVHTNMVQLCVANLSGAAAAGVTASIERITEWPLRFDLENSKLLRDLKFLRPDEVLRFDLGSGPDLFRGDEAAVFRAHIAFESLDGRKFTFDDTLKIESVTGHGNWRIYGIDDVARMLKDIADTLKSVTGIQRLKVDTFNGADRQEERRLRNEQRERFKGAQQQPGPDPTSTSADPPKA
ncbi:hypothetical protein ABVV53_00070 [Novosphingobium sp. RD2P27]|uniref:Uncharacterized protein n=1 Tax=Novosphingobium kalidii TaxID=3230299 RepID=A0ABV2CW87_9SPHN